MIKTLNSTWPYFGTEPKVFNMHQAPRDCTYSLYQIWKENGQGVALHYDKKDCQQTSLYTTSVIGVVPLQRRTLE